MHDSDIGSWLQSESIPRLTHFPTSSTIRILVVRFGILSWSSLQRIAFYSLPFQPNPFTERCATPSPFFYYLPAYRSCWLWISCGMTTVWVISSTRTTANNCVVICRNQGAKRVGLLLWLTLPVEGPLADLPSTASWTNLVLQIQKPLPSKSRLRRVNTKNWIWCRYRPHIFFNRTWEMWILSNKFWGWYWPCYFSKRFKAFPR